MKRIFTINLLLLLLTFSTKLNAQFTDTDIKFWAGEGSSSVVLVVDFRDGTSDPSFAFGYRYQADGELTFADLLQAVADAEPQFKFAQSDIGFLEDINYNHHGALSGHPDWWSTWSGDNLAEMYMNNGISELLVNSRWYGVSYGFMPEPLAPTVTYPAYSSLWFTPEDVTFWIGEGEKKSTIVIDFNTGGDSPVTFAWGIKYNGTITAKEALTLISETDTDLNITISENEITGITYNGLQGISNEENNWNAFKATNMSSWIKASGITTQLADDQWFGITYGTTTARRPFIPTAAEDNIAGTIDYNKSVFTAYPNPVTSVLNIKSNADIQKIEIYNITGQSIATVINTDVIDLGGINPGVYFVKVYTENGSSTQKIIKQ